MNKPKRPKEIVEAPNPAQAALEDEGFSGIGLIDLFDRFEETTFWIKDREGRFKWVNKALVMNYALPSREAIIGKTDFDLADATFATQYRVDDERVLKGERIDSRVELIGRYDHSFRWGVTSKIPVRDSKGRIIGTAGISYPYQKGEIKLKDESPLAPAMKIITEGFRYPIDRQALADACGLSLRVFYRKFQAAYRVSPHDFVRNLRIRASCHDLAFTRKTLSAIAHEYGFSDQSHFNREFQRIVGESPRAYRKRQGGE